MSEVLAIATAATRKAMNSDVAVDANIDPFEFVAAAVLDALEEHGWSVFPLRDESRPENVRAAEQARIVDIIDALPWWNYNRYNVISVSELLRRIENTDG